MKKLTVVLMMVLHFKVIADSESENNNSEASADTLSSGVAMAGRLSNQDDWDYFKLEVSSTENFNLLFESPYSKPGENQWLVAIQEPRNSYIIFQEALSPSEGNPVDRTITVEDNGTFIVFIAPVLGATAVPHVQYKLTITPKNFQTPPGTYNGVWQDDKGLSFYSLHESLEGLLYLELKQDGTAWKAYYGGRIGNKATLEQVIGSGTAALELTFISDEKVEARYEAFRTSAGEICDANDRLLYTGSRVFRQ